MNICVVSNQLKKTFSGIGLHTNNLVKSLLKDGHQVWVMAPEDQRPGNITSYQFWDVPRPLFNTNQARWITLSWAFAHALENLLERQHIDLIHFTDARESFFYQGKTPALGNINDTYSAELHSLAFYRRYYTDWYARWLYYHSVHILEGIALRRLPAVIANSQFTSRLILEQYHLKPERLFTCYKSIDPDRYQLALTRRSELGQHSPRILFVGTNMQRKGLPVLIKAAPAVLRSFPLVEFWVVGEDKILPRMKELCVGEGVLEKFRFLGWKSQNELVDSIYPQSDLFVMPSFTEALGMVFLEAMASGIPVIGTEVGGIPEIIQNGSNGLTVGVDQPDMLAGAIIKLLGDRLFYQNVQEQGFETVKKFSVSHMMACTYAIYQNTIKQSA